MPGSGTRAERRWQRRPRPASRAARHSATGPDTPLMGQSRSWHWRQESRRPPQHLETLRSCRFSRRSADSSWRSALAAVPEDSRIPLRLLHPLPDRGLSLIKISCELADRPLPRCHNSTIFALNSGVTNGDAGASCP
jgi:hypothetical protein